MSHSALNLDPDEDQAGLPCPGGQVSSESFLATLVKLYLPIMASLPREMELF